VERRRRPRRRARGLVADPTTTLDLAGYEPALELDKRGQELWDQFADEPPFWWDGADVPMVAVLCATLDAVGAALKSNDVSPAGKAAIVKEWRTLADQLGLSPTSRGRLKMTEAQGAVAAKKVESMGAKRAQAIDIDELDDDG